MHVREIFLAAIQHDCPADRAAYLDCACGGDTELLDRVAALLRADAASDGFLQPRVAVRPTVESPQSAGPFELRETVGHGGMGVVFRAWDARLERDVAVKLLHGRAAGDTAATARFRYEARVTARLAHPGVPPVHDVGELPDGRPYLAMKLVEGRTLHELLTARPDPSHDRGRLVTVFEMVCQAVAFAHSRNILHRDLKPANVMVGAFGEVQVMDWGLAKDLTAPPAEARDASSPLPVAGPHDDAETLAFWTAEGRTPVAGDSDGTRAGLVLGTPGYMAPEQARGEPADRRSDVFGLGAVLCAVLTGSAPFAGPSTADTLRLNAHGDPTEAQERLADCGADTELVALCERCLSADPTNRPADAAAVAAEVAAWRGRTEERARQAQADRAETSVRERELRKRRRVWASLGSALIAVLAVGAGVSAWLAIRATDAEGKTASQLDKTLLAEASARTEADNARAAEGVAVEREREARAAAELARRKESEATESAADAKAFGDFLANNFLAATRPLEVQRGVGVDVRVSEALAKAEADIAVVFAGRPLAEARVRHEVGVTWRNLGKYERAEPHLKRAVELREQGFGPDHPDTLDSLNSLAVNHCFLKRFDIAEPMLRRVVDGLRRAGPTEQRHALRAECNLGQLYIDRSDFPTAERILSQNHAGTERLLGPDHPDTLDGVSGLGRLYRAWRRWDEAARWHARARAGYEKVFGPEHVSTLINAHALADAYGELGKVDEALALDLRAKAGLEAAVGPDHPFTLDVTSSVAMLYQRRNDPAAEPLFRKALAGYERVLGPDHPDTLRTASNLAVICWQSGRLDESVPLFDRVYRQSVRANGPTHPNTLMIGANLAVNLKDAGRAGEAVPMLEAAYAERRRIPQLGFVPPQLADAYRLVGRPKDAAQVLSADLADNRERLSPYALSRHLALLGTVLLDTEPVAAEPVLRECLKIREKLSPNDWTTANTKSMLGGALLAQGRAAEAEPLLTAGYAGLLRGVDKIPPQGKGNLPDAVDRLLSLSLKLGRPEEYARWQVVRAAYPRETAPPPRRAAVTPAIGQ